MLGGRVFAISTDRWEDLPFRAEQLEAGLTLLADPDEVIISDYGLRDSTLGEAVARPASFILDREGRVAWRYLPPDWRLRAGPDVYMEAFGKVLRGEVSL
jgi:peroxiredoxin